MKTVTYLAKATRIKRILLVALSFIAFTGCSKDNALADQSVVATIDYQGDPRADGFGWTLRVGNTVEVPTNLPDEFKQDELSVNVVYKPSEQFFPCRCAERKRMVDILSISKSGE